MISIIKKIFDFLSSIKLAVILIIFFGVLLSWATFYESEHGTPAAQRDIYKTIWFDVFLFFLGINVAFSAISRYPWKKHHVGFLVTHLGILIILFGSAMTRKFGVEGQLILQENEQSDEMLLSDNVLAVSIPRLNVRETFDPWFQHSKIPDGKEIRYPVGETGVECYVVDYLSNPRSRMHVTDDGPPGQYAVHFTIFQSGHTHAALDEWLLSDHPRSGILNLQGARITFSKVDSQAELEQKFTPPTSSAPQSDTDKGELIVQNEADEEVFKVALSDVLNQSAQFSIEGATYSLTVTDFLPRATVNEGALINNKSGPMNPAVRATLKGPSGAENHIAFSLFPDVESMHGGSENTNGLKVRFNYTIDSASTNQPDRRNNQLDLYIDPQEDLHYRVSNQGGLFATGTITIGTPFNTSWGNFMMQVEELKSNARLVQEFYDAGMNTEGPHNNPAVQVRVEHNGDSRESYVFYNNPRTLNVGGDQCIIEFGQKRYPLGFTIQLIDFQAPRYPGTNRPQRFQSKVKLIDPEENINQDQLVYMNHPLGHDDFLVYQSSYIEGKNGEPDISIFSVARAPGTPIIYVGSIVMILGMIIIFFSKKYGRRRSVQF